jgi:hypothetical protein
MDTPTPGVRVPVDALGLSSAVSIVPLWVRSIHRWAARTIIAHVLPSMALLTSGATAVTCQGVGALHLEPLATIGVLEGDRDEVFGNVRAVARADSVLFVLDEMNGRISAFTNKGHYITAAGRRGRGPGELRWPRDISVEDDHVYVFDPGNLKVAVYGFSAGRLTSSKDVRLPFSAAQMCMLGGDIYLLGYHDGHLLHRIDPSGAVNLSFGRPFRADHPLLAQRSAHGRILCDSETRSVLVAAETSPQVRRYSADGELLWEASIPGFVATEMTLMGPGAVRYSAPPGQARSTVAVSLLLIASEVVLVQYAEPPEGIRALEDIVAVESALFGVSDGSVLSRSSDLPRVDHADGDLVYSRGNDPFPRIQVYRIKWRNS